MKTLQPVRRFHHDQSGTTAVEFAIVGLLAILLCVGMVEFGRALHLANELSYAADRGTRLLLLNPEISDQDVVAEVRAHLRLANTDGLVILTSNVTTGSQTARGLSLSIPLTLLIPTFRVQGLRVGVERNVPMS